MKMKLGIIIQARMGSTRLPSKVLKPLVDSTVLGILIARLGRLGCDLIVATTDSHKDDELYRWLSDHNVDTFRGAENNVLDRFIQAAETKSITHLIRVCADSPFIDIAYLEKLIKVWKEEPQLEYLSYSFEGRPTVLSHFGVFAELVKVDGLKREAQLFPGNLAFMEHVTLGIYSNPDAFRIKLIPLDEEIAQFKGIRLTIDTIEDYTNIQYLVEKYKHITKDSFQEIALTVMAEQRIFEEMQVMINENKK